MNEVMAAVFLDPNGPQIRERRARDAHRRHRRIRDGDPRHLVREHPAEHRWAAVQRRATIRRARAHDQPRRPGWRDAAVRHVLSRGSARPRSPRWTRPWRRGCRRDRWNRGARGAAVAGARAVPSSGGRGRVGRSARHTSRFADTRRAPFVLAFDVPSGVGDAGRDRGDRRELHVPRGAVGPSQAFTRLRTASFSIGRSASLARVAGTQMPSALYLTTAPTTAVAMGG